MRNRRKLIRTLLLLVCTYALCWFPLYLINTYDLFMPQQHSSIALTLFAVVLSHANCALNPIIYAYGMPGYKHTLRRFVGLKGGSLKSPIMQNFSQLPLPTTKHSLTQHSPPYTIGCTRDRWASKKYSWSQLGKSMDSADGSLNNKVHLRPINEAQVCMCVNK